MVLANVLIQGWIISSYVNGFFYCSFYVLIFSPHYAEVVNGDSMTRDVVVVIDGEGGFRCSLNLSDHRRFSLRCLSEGLIPVSVRLKSNIKTPKGRQIIKKAEIALLNERVRSINILSSCLPCKGIHV